MADSSLLLLSTSPKLLRCQSFGSGLAALADVGLPRTFRLELILSKLAPCLRRIAPRMTIS